jgi:hypothetical protein
MLRPFSVRGGETPAEIEVYAGAAHGWCPPDSAVYNEKQAERAWSRPARAVQRRARVLMAGGGRCHSARAVVSVTAGAVLSNLERPGPDVIGRRGCAKS